MIQRQPSRVFIKRHFVYLVSKVVYSLLCCKEDGGREYALEEFTPCAAIQSLESFLLENGQKPMKSRSVTLGALISCLQSTLDNASGKKGGKGAATRQVDRKKKRDAPSYMYG